MTQESQTNTGSPIPTCQSAPANSIGVPFYSQPKTSSARKLPAWLLSFFFHSLLLGVAVVLLSQFESGGSQVENRTGGIVLVNATSESTEYLTDGETEEQSEQTESSNSPASAIIDDLPPNLPGLEIESQPIAGAGDSLIDGLSGADSLVEIPSTSSNSNFNVGGKVTTEVFGVKGTGSRFVYVIDRSKSMAGFEGRPMAAARQQLLASIESLDKNNRFQIIFYNQGVRIFNPDGMPTMYKASEEMIVQAKSFVRRTQPTGGTDHVNALRRAFRLNPDVIFFLTDAEGGFTDGELRIVSSLNRSAAVINAIQFGERAGLTPSLEKVARNSGGQYIFKNIRTLRIEGTN